MGTNVIRIDKGAERYVICFDDAHRDDAIRQLARWARNPELSFGVYDAARGVNGIRALPQECEPRF